MGNKKSKPQFKPQFYIYQKNNNENGKTTNSTYTNYLCNIRDEASNASKLNACIKHNTDTSIMEVRNTKPLKLDGEHIDSKTY